MSNKELLDRAVPPAIKEISGFKNIKGTSIEFPNGVPLHYVKEGVDDIIYVEWFFHHGGSKYAKKLGVAYLTSRGLYEGCTSMPESKLIEYLDRLGIFISFSANQDHSAVYIYALKKNLLKALPILKEMLFDPLYPQDQIELLINNLSQSVLVEKEKNNYWAKKLFDSNIFGKSHPYGQTVDETHLEKVEIQDIIDFHHLGYKHFSMFVGGDVDGALIKELENHFGQFKVERNFNPPSIDLIKPKHSRVFQKAPQAMQSSLRLGFLTVNQKHEDYSYCSIVSSILGGYFGSRLMKNLREDKGYTYGIGSSIKHFESASVFTISGDVKEETVMEAVAEISKEMELLRSEKIAEQEIIQHRRYMMGSYLSAINSPFAHINRYKTLILKGLDYDYLDRSIASIKEMSATKIQEVAQKHFDPKQMLEVIVTAE